MPIEKFIVRSGETPEEAKRRYIGGGYEPCQIGSTGGKALYFIMLGLGLVPIMNIAITFGLLIIGLIRLYSKKYYYQKTKSEPITKPDRRYSVGYRVIGYQDVCYNVGLPADEEELAVNKKWGKIFLYTALGVGLWSMIITPIALMAS